MKKKRPLKKIKKLKTTTKYQTKFLIFRNCPKKGAQGEAVFILSALKSVFGEDEAEEAAESSSSKCWPGYTYFVQLN